MTRRATLIFILGSITAVLAVAFGAFGAHSLRSFVAAERLATFETGVRYQMYHALSLMIMGLVQQSRPAFRLHRPAFLMLVGILVFSGSLYVLVLFDAEWIGAITPVGGIGMIAAWIWTAVHVLRNQR